MDTHEYINEIIRMKDHDLIVRQHLAESGELFDGYNSEMEQVHIANARRLETFMGRMGWPTRKKAGTAARDAAMLIALHAISLPDFQRACLLHIAAAVELGEEDKRNVAFLYDRIWFNEQRPQKFGIQYDWDEYDEMSPWKIENPETVNARRKEYGLNPIEEETKAVRQGVRDCGGKPPASYSHQQQEIAAWSRKFKWIE